VRVIAGSAGGIRLLSARGMATRPTLDRVRESLFGILAPRLAGAQVLDLYAGTGALGLEALSRGAEGCVFVECDARALDVLRRNLLRTGLAARARVEARRLPQGLAGLARTGPFDLVLCDPPYALRPWAALLSGVLPLLSPGAVVACEHAAQDELPLPGELRVLRRERYGQTSVSLLGRSEV